TVVTEPSPHGGHSASSLQSAHSQPLLSDLPAPSVHRGSLTPWRSSAEGLRPPGNKQQRDRQGGSFLFQLTSPNLIPPRLSPPLILGLWMRHPQGEKSREREKDIYLREEPQREGGKERTAHGCLEAIPSGEQAAAKHTGHRAEVLMAERTLHPLLASAGPIRQ
ncbi:hypothetical protein JOQ06_027227, partial [Pogonophryne albipinna]